MALTYIGYDDVSAYTVGTAATDSGIHIEIGDLLIVAVTITNNDTWCTGLTDTAGNSFTVRAAVLFDFSSTVICWCIATAENASDIFTASFNNANERRKNVGALVIRPDAGDTVSLDVTGSGGSTFEATPWETGVANTTGTDEVIFAAFQSGSGAITYTNQEIPSGTAATVLTDELNGFTAFYRIATGTIANCGGEVDPSASANYTAAFVSFISVAAAGATLEQEGFRSRNDDGDETTATWDAAQDANIQAPAGTTKRLRFIVNATGDPDATQYQLEGKLSTDSEWTKIT
jgi:hypothetical protein